MVREIYTVNDASLNNLPKKTSMGLDTPLFVHRSSGFDTSSVPFVFTDGVLSFYSPSTAGTSSGFARSASPPACSVSNASFLGVLPDVPHSAGLPTHPLLQKLIIWRHTDEGKDHVYAATSCINSPSTHETTSFEDLDPSLVRYSAVHARLSQISAMPCPVMHAFITLTPCYPAIAEDHPINSVITVSIPYRRPVRLMYTIYNRGTLAFANETVMTEEACSHFGDAQYSTTLPQQLVDELCEEVDGMHSNEEGMLDSIAVLQFMQHTDEAENGDESVILVLVCDFEIGQGPTSTPGRTRFSHLSLGTIQSQDLTIHMESLPTSPASQANLSNVNQFTLGSIQNCKQRRSSRGFSKSIAALGTIQSQDLTMYMKSIPSLPSHDSQSNVNCSTLGSIRNSKQRAPSRACPKLSVSIPPPCHVKGRIQLYTDSPGPTLTPDIPFPPTPQTGVPQNVFPVTPFDQLIAIPLHTPEMHRSSPGHAMIHTESTYSFTLTAVSPSVQSPASGLLDSSHPGEAESPGPYPSRTCTPSTPSPLL